MDGSWKEKLVDELINRGIIKIDKGQEDTEQDMTNEPCGKCPAMDEQPVVDAQPPVEEDTAELVKDQTSPAEQGKGSYYSKKLEVEIKNGQEQATVEVNDNGNIMQETFSTVQDALSYFNAPKERDQVRNEDEKIEEKEDESEETDETEDAEDAEEVEDTEEVKEIEKIEKPEKDDDESND